MSEPLTEEAYQDALNTPFVARLIRELRRRLGAHTSDLAISAGSDPEIKLRTLGGRIAELNDIFRTIEGWREKQ